MTKTVIGKRTSRTKQPPIPANPADTLRTGSALKAYALVGENTAQVLDCCADGRAAF
ncbi:MAG: hypothetical protein AMXMBFR7_14800 [Planctomycetota bacterium]